MPCGGGGLLSGLNGGRGFGLDLTQPGDRDGCGAGRAVRIYAGGMCGRIASAFSWGQLHRLLRLLSLPPEVAARYNVAPSDVMPIVRERGGVRECVEAVWGLEAPWASGAGGAGGAAMPRPTNARAETIAQKPMFRDAFTSRRCVVPVSGFYEWQARAGGAKRPQYVTRADGQPMLLAGIWNDLTAVSFAVVTTAAPAGFAIIHDRAPLVLESDQVDRWLNAPRDEAAKMLRPVPDGILMWHEVSTRVNSVKNQGPELIQPRVGGGGGGEQMLFGE